MVNTKFVNLLLMFFWHPAHSVCSVVVVLSTEMHNYIANTQTLPIFDMNHPYICPWDNLIEWDNGVAIHVFRKITHLPWT